MNAYNLLEAMSGIRDQYIEEAAGAPFDGISAGWSGQGKSASGLPASGKKTISRKKSILRLQHWAAAAAALVCLSIVAPNVSPGAALAFRDLPLVGQYFRLVTFRTYEYQDAVSDAVVEEGRIVAMSADSSVIGEDELEEDAAQAGAAEAEGASEQDSEKEASASVQSLLSAAQVTEEIRSLAKESVESFEESMKEEAGYHSLRFLCETVTDTDDWFCLSVLSYTSSADGFEQVTHFVINKENGRRLLLSDCFADGVDYVTPLSENIKEQMRERMKVPDTVYWLDSTEDPESDFREISEEQDFYIDADGKIVICFDEMEVAPMYMGTAEFVIPPEVTDGIRSAVPGLYSGF